MVSVGIDVASLVSKIDVLERSLRGTVGQHQISMIAHQARHIDYLNIEIASLDDAIKKNRMLRAADSALGRNPRYWQARSRAHYC